MKTWRVGTFSMGALLVLLGLLLFFAKILGWNLVHLMTSWWPILLIVLGVEILIYLFIARRQEQPVLQYDFLSIFFVGLIGTAGIMLALLSSTGLLGKVETVLAKEERSFELPNFAYQILDSVKRVVVRTTGYDMTVETSEEKEVSMFGTYRVQTVNNKKAIKSAEDYIAATKKGDTLYVNVKTLPNEAGPFYSHESIAATLLVPSNVKLEVIGNGNTLTLKPRELMNDWNIEGASAVSVDASDSKDLKISAVGVEEIRGKENEWKITEQHADADGPHEGRSAAFQSGEGKYQINIANAYSISLHSGQ